MAHHTLDFWIVRNEETGEEQEVVPGDFFTIYLIDADRTTLSLDPVVRS
jgi:hypothetical protein